MFDVCVIGSGPAGGVLAKELAESGAKVALVEAGRMMSAKDFRYHTWPYDLPYRGAKEGAQPSPAYPRDVTEAIRYENSDKIRVDRIRAVGGRSIHWNAVCLRFAPRDFRERSVEGIEEDWPISYQDVAPYYSYVEKMIGVCGSRDNLEILPDAESYLPPLKFRCSEVIIKRVCDKMGIPMVAVRKALLTQPYDDRPPCHYCGHCMSGCDVGAIFTVPNSMLPKALKTGHCTLIPNKLARELLVDREGKVRAVSVIETVTRREEEIRARVFAVCCAAIESARLLLNSRSPQFPNGLANSSDLVGRYLSGHVNAGFIAYLEELIAARPVNNDGALDHTYIARFNQNLKRDYAGGYGYQVDYMSYMFPHHAKYLKGFGKTFKKQVRLLQPAFFQMGGYGKALAQPENRVTVDPHQLDAYGIPIPVIRFRFGENDRALWKDMREKAQEILNAAKCRLIVNTDEGEPHGFASHETGTARMGHDPRASVLNSYCQAHDVKNLFVVDGSCFTTFPEKNPTLTIMALAVRTARYMASEVRKGNL